MDGSDTSLIAGRRRPRAIPALVVAIAVTVTRTGGIAGMRRRGARSPTRAEPPHWITLIEECPWDAADPARPIPPTGADRFVWHVDARCGEQQREAALPDPEVQGPWRELIDAVRRSRAEPRRRPQPSR